MADRGEREFLLDITEACKRIREFVKNMSYEDFLRDTKLRMQCSEILK